MGSIGWFDLTVTDAEGLRDFYAKVVGWTTTEVPMNGYSDYCMHPTGSATPVAGICHSRGANANIPPQWIAYMLVPDLEASLVQVQEGGGKILVGPRAQGNSRFAIIQDPAGATCGLYQP